MRKYVICLGFAMALTVGACGSGSQEVGQGDPVLGSIWGGSGHPANDTGTDDPPKMRPATGRRVIPEPSPAPAPVVPVDVPVPIEVVP